MIASSLVSRPRLLSITNSKTNAIGLDKDLNRLRTALTVPSPLAIVGGGCERTDGWSTMWSVLNGTIFNAITVGVGSGVGLLVSGRLAQRYQRIVLDVLGLVTITLGVDAAVNVMNETVARYQPTGDAGRTYGATLAMVAVGSLLVGCLVGSWLRLHERGSMPEKR